MRNLFFAASILTSVVARSQSYMEEMVLSDTSLNKMFCVNVIRKDSSDSQVVWKYYLKSLSNRLSPDSLILARAVTHDIAPPVFFWSKNSTKLIYEDGQGLKHENRKIKIFDLIERKVIFGKDGILNVPFEMKEPYYDSQLGILLFFNFNSLKECDFLALDIRNLKIWKLKSILTSGDPYTKIPWIKKAWKDRREILLQYEGDDNKIFNVKLNY